MTTNISKSLNVVIRYARELPIFFMLEVLKMMCCIGGSTKERTM